MSVEVTEAALDADRNGLGEGNADRMVGPGQLEDVLPGGPATTDVSPAIAVQRPKFVFLGVVAAVALLLDVLTKAWAEIELSRRVAGDPTIVMIDNHLGFTLAYNRGGAWGLLQNASEALRRPFFLVVSVIAIVFIVSLYNRLSPTQRALRWGLPMVLGGALGNLADRVVRGSVVDFIDYRADWVQSMNELIALVSNTWHVTDHWPTFNVADICICIGVGLMAIDMFTNKRPPTVEEVPSADPPGSDAEPTSKAQPAGS